MKEKFCQIQACQALLIFLVLLENLRKSIEPTLKFYRFVHDAFQLIILGFQQTTKFF